MKANDSGGFLYGRCSRHEKEPGSPGRCDRDWSESTSSWSTPGFSTSWLILRDLVRSNSFRRRQTKGAPALRQARIAGMHAVIDGVRLHPLWYWLAKVVHNLLGPADLHCGLLCQFYLGFRREWVAEDGCSILNSVKYTRRSHQSVHCVMSKLMAELIATESGLVPMEIQKVLLLVSMASIRIRKRVPRSEKTQVSCRER